MTRMALWAILGMIPFMASAEPAKPLSAKKIEAIARSAKTADDHKQVASHYQTHAEAMEAKAQRHEAKAAELASRNTFNPLRHKWPAMAEGPLNWERDQAQKARKAAQESTQLTLKHREMAQGAGTDAAE